MALVRAAILAASPHNTQPWRFKVSNSAVELHIDRQRNVGALDPYLREEFIGMGCALENLLLTAPPNGYSASLSLAPGQLTAISPEPQSELVARVDLVSAERAASELYQAIPRRHTNRGPYDLRKPLPPGLVGALNRLPGSDEQVRLFIFTAEAERQRIVELSSAANTEIYSDPQVEAASQRWIRLKSAEVQKFRDGLTIDNFGLPPFTTALAKALPEAMLTRMAARGQMHGYAERMLTAPLIGIIAVRDRYAREQCLAAGRLWQRAHLWATARGLAARPANESVELIDYQRMLGRPARALAQLSEITADPPWQPTFVFLMGHPTLTAHASPRRSVQQVLNS